jgi:hypothetical protein
MRAAASIYEIEVPFLLTQKQAQTFHLINSIKASAGYSLLPDASKQALTSSGFILLTLAGAKLN